MLLNRDEIKTSGIISDLNEDNLENSSYDLSVSSLMDMKGKEHSSYKIPPQGMVYAIFKEKLTVPKYITAFAHVKTSLTQRGIMATNIGIIDPCYDGYVSTLLINFGSKPFTIDQDTPALRITFNKISEYKEKDNNRKPLKFEEYKKLRNRDTDHLEEKFLNLGSVGNEVFVRVMKYLVGLGILFSAGSFAVAMYFQNKTSSEKELDKAVKRYELQTQTLIEENKLLKSKLDNIEKSLEKLRTDPVTNYTINPVNKSKDK